MQILHKGGLIDKEMDLSRQLMKYRIAAGYSQGELAELLVVDQSKISRMEKGKMPPQKDLSLVGDWIYVCTHKPVRFTYERDEDGSRMSLSTV